MGNNVNGYNDDGDWVDTAAVAAAFDGDDNEEAGQHLR